MNNGSKELISVIIPTYNMRRPLIRCFDALSRQTRLPDEVIVVDDGSIDGTQEAVHAETAARDLPLRSITQNHAGASVARNRGFAASQGQYVMFLDADVVLKKHAIERFYETLTQTSKLKPQNSGIGFAYSSFRWGWKKFSSFPFDEERLHRMPYIHTTSLVRRAALPDVPFDERLKRLQDWDLYLTLLERGYIGTYIPEILFTVETQGTMSKWLPSILYQIPFEKFGLTMERMEKYRQAEDIIKKKHNL